MSSLIFIYNELLNAELQAELRVPLEFVSFAHTDAKMFTHFHKKGVFAVPHDHIRVWGNTKVYGALFVCKDMSFHIDTLDAFHACSKNKLYKNHIKDMHHRIEVVTTPIYFETLDDLARLKYREREEITAIAYFGNPKHPKIKRRFSKTESKRVISGIYKEDFRKLFRRVVNGL